jgi:hypothetical protein
MQNTLDRFRAETRLQEQVIETFLSKLSAPTYGNIGKNQSGFAFREPDAVHFCLMKAIKSVSGLNAAIVLLENGFNHEICVLIRTIVESTTYMEFVMSDLDSENSNSPQGRLIENYFADCNREKPEDFQRFSVRQEKQHKIVGRDLDEQLAGTDDGDRFVDVDTAKLMSNVYLTFSNYVHGRYPEVMELFGGSPGFFHLEGMRGTPNENDAVEIIDCYLETVSNTLRQMVYKFGNIDALRSSPKLLNWLTVSGSD